VRHDFLHMCVMACLRVIPGYRTALGHTAQQHLPERLKQHGGCRKLGALARKLGRAQRNKAAYDDGEQDHKVPQVINALRQGVDQDSSAWMC